VFLKHGIEVFNFGLQGSSWKPKEHDTRMGKFLVKGPAGAFKQKITVSRFLPFHPPY